MLRLLYSLDVRTVGKLGVSSLASFTCESSSSASDTDASLHKVLNRIQPVQTLRRTYNPQPARVETCGDAPKGKTNARVFRGT